MVRLTRLPLNVASKFTALLNSLSGLFNVTDAEAALYTNVYGKNISKNQFVAYVQKTF